MRLEGRHRGNRRELLQGAARSKYRLLTSESAVRLDWQHRGNRRELLQGVARSKHRRSGRRGIQFATNIAWSIGFIIDCIEVSQAQESIIVQIVEVGARVSGGRLFVGVFFIGAHPIMVLTMPCVRRLDRAEQAVVGIIGNNPGPAVQ